MATTQDEYKGSKTIKLIPNDNPDTKYPFSFGLAKAKLIIENLEDIQNFIRENDPSYEF